MHGTMNVKFTYFSVCSHILYCIILLASCNIPIPPQQMYVCSLCASNQFHLTYLLQSPLYTSIEMIALAGQSTE